MSSIGVLRESSLHASLKQLYSEDQYDSEVTIHGFVVDLVAGNRIVEIQTGNFSNLRRKLQALLEDYQVLIVYPIAVEKHIVRLSSTGEILSRRKSPARGSKYEIFKELVYITQFLGHANFEIEIVETVEEVLWINDGKGSWRRGKWSILDRQLLRILGKDRMNKKTDYALPRDIEEIFTVKDLSKNLGIRARLAGKMAFVLRSIGVIAIVGKQQRAYLYKRLSPNL